MIIFREKLFRRDNISETSLKFLLDDPELVKKYGPSKLNIIASKKYNEDIQKLGIKGSTDRNNLDKLKKDIKDGYLFIDGPGKGDTHPLGDFSKLNKSFLFSKEISDQHRLNYRVFPPRVIIDNDKKEKYIQDVVLVSCYGHETEEGDYLNDKNLRARKNRMRGNAPYRKPESIMKKKKKKS